MRLVWVRDLPYYPLTGWRCRTMRLRAQDDDVIDVRLSLDELMLIRSVLREVCEGMHFSDNDFQTIFGINRADAEGLLMRTTNVIERLRLDSK
jgi:hypothetical protein